MGSEDNNKGDEIMLLYHGSPVIVEKPEIRTAKFHKDFYFGFYCTEMETQAKRWATRFGDGYVNKYEYTKNAYAAKKYAFVSDMARLFVLSQYGGIYFDTDVEVIRPFEDILETGGYLGIEVHKKQFYVNPGLGFACVKESPVIEGIFDVYKNQIFDEAKLKDCNIVTITTAFLLEKGLQKTNEIQKIDDITVYPQDFFNPRDMSTGKLNLTSNTRSIHHFSASWVDKGFLLRGRIYRFINRHFGNNVATLVRKVFGRRKK
jgi:hypothetical protein